MNCAAFPTSARHHPYNTIRMYSLLLFASLMCFFRNFLYMRLSTCICLLSALPEESHNASVRCSSLLCCVQMAWLCSLFTSFSLVCLHIAFLRPLSTRCSLPVSYVLYSDRCISSYLFSFFAPNHFVLSPLLINIL